MRRVAALLVKEILDLRQNPAIFLPALITGLASVSYPFLIAVGIPYVTGELLSESSDFELAVEVYRVYPLTERLDPEGAIQAWIFLQSLVLVIGLTPIAGAMSVAAHSVIGEKQARTLEPLLATPIATRELLAAKILGAALPALALTLLCFTCYLLGIASVARPGVWRVLFAPHALAVVGLLTPLAALVAIQLAVCASSRVNDPRSAQQIGALIVLPVAALLIAQLTGTVLLTLPMVIAVAAGLTAVNAVLLAIAVRLFDRESILTRWR